MSQPNLEEIRQAALAAATAAYAPQIIDIPGFEEEQTIQVAIRRVDMQPIVLRTLGNPVLAALERTREGQNPDEPVPMSPEDMAAAQRELPDLLREVCKVALVAPTWDEFEGLGGLTFDQQLVIAEKAAGRLRELASFRGD